MCVCVCVCVGGCPPPFKIELLDRITTGATGFRRAALAFRMNIIMVVTSTKGARRMFAKGQDKLLLNMLVEAGPEKVMLRVQDARSEFGLIMSVVSKHLRHLSEDQEQQLLQSTFPAYLVRCLELVAAGTDAEFQPRAAAYVMMF